MSSFCRTLGSGVAILFFRLLNVVVHWCLPISSSNWYRQGLWLRCSLFLLLQTGPCIWQLLMRHWGLLSRCSHGQGSRCHRCSGEWLLRSLWGVVVVVGHVMFLSGLGPGEQGPGDGNTDFHFFSGSQDQDSGACWLWVWGHFFQVPGAQLGGSGAQDVPPGATVQRPAGPSSHEPRHSPL